MPQYYVIREFSLVVDTEGTSGSIKKKKLIAVTNDTHVNFELLTTVSI